MRRNEEGANGTHYYEFTGSGFWYLDGSDFTETTMRDDDRLGSQRRRLHDVAAKPKDPGVLGDAIDVRAAEIVAELAGDG